MGIWYAKKCEPIVQGSVINLSKDCIQFLETGKPPRKTASKKNCPLEEESYFSTMRDIDDTHSRSSGINFENFSKMANNLEAKLTSNRMEPCAKGRLLTCLQENEFCMIKCNKEMDKFIDCLDAFRLEVMNSKLENKDLVSPKKPRHVNSESKFPEPKRKIYLSD